MREGDTFYLEDLLYSIMLESHNDSAWAIAEHIAGSVENFTDLMDKKAKDLGCGHTNFVILHYGITAERCFFADYTDKV